MNPLSSIEGAIAASGSRNSVLVVQTNLYKESPLLGVRRWYIDKKTEEWKPTKKGISLSKKGFVFLKAVFNTENERILDWFDSASTEAISKDKEQELASYEQLAGNFGLKVKTSEWVGPEIARVSVIGAEQVLTLNLRHPVGEAIGKILNEISSSGATDRERQMLSTLLYFVASLERVPLMFEGEQTWKAEELFDAVRWNVGILMNTFAKRGEIEHVI